MRHLVQNPSEAAAAVQPMAVDIREAARLTNTSPSTIRRAIAAGKLRAAKIGASLRLRPADLDAWLIACASNNVERTE
jgi:excisionase family DNA binding protein